MDNSTEEILKEYEKATETKSTGHRVVSDYSRFDPRAGVQEIVEAEKEVHVRKKAPMPKARISVVSILLYLVIAGLAMLLLNSYVNLTVLTNEVAAKTEEYEKLQDEYVRIQAENDQQYNLSEIEEYVVNELGMTKVETDKIETIELATQESITVIKDEGEEKLSGVFDGLLEKLRSIVEFLA